ncbi:phospholipase A and acyltransferase 1-like [Carassius gibelio]|uniref:phospholipase A and acyltransferase 1-like n=1 Tax=Carassius gibelio TaxID=101364 RepID=UPI002279775E|nr:phospholipase A and acyltransferase 1-like [Carassius gibelio]
MDYKEQVEQVVSTAQLGDLIEFTYPIGYSHWGVFDGDGYIIHFSVADESQAMSKFRNCLQTIFPFCGDLMIGETKISPQLLSEVNVPKGAHVSVSNNQHDLEPSPVYEIRKRRDALLDKVYTYKLFTHNCEHFATFVRSGKAMCNQIPGKPKNKECVESTELFSFLEPSR